MVEMLDIPLKIHLGTQTLKLHKVASEILREGLYWVLGNAKKIKIWEDKILDNPPSETMEYLEEIKAWMEERGLNKPRNICL